WPAPVSSKPSASPPWPPAAPSSSRPPRKEPHRDAHTRAAPPGRPGGHPHHPHRPGGRRGHVRAAAGSDLGRRLAVRRDRRPRVPGRGLLAVSGRPPAPGARRDGGRVIPDDDPDYDAWVIDQQSPDYHG